VLHVFEKLSDFFNLKNKQVKTIMNKTAIALALITATGSANAVLVNGSTLNIGEGSFFAMGGNSTIAAPGFDGQFITGYQGLVLGTVQTPTGSHAGVPDGSESPMIDNPWLFFQNTGMHGNQSASNVLTASGNTASIDFSGWSISWNGLDSGTASGPVLLEAGAWFGSTVNGVAQVTCGVDCGDGDTYTLIYSAHTGCGNPSSGCSQYLLNLTGTISAVPIPSAIWLFGSGLMALAGAARFRKAV
jgi:hypothetical protein